MRTSAAIAHSFGRSLSRRGKPDRHGLRLGWYPLATSRTWTDNSSLSPLQYLSIYMLPLNHVCGPDICVTVLLVDAIRCQPTHKIQSLHTGNIGRYELRIAVIGGLRRIIRIIIRFIVRIVRSAVSLGRRLGYPQWPNVQPCLDPSDIHRSHYLWPGQKRYVRAYITAPVLIIQFISYLTLDKGYILLYRLHVVNMLWNISRTIRNIIR